MRDRLEVLQHSDATDALSEFARWYLSQAPALPLKPPCDNVVQAVEGIHGVVIWRQGRFQVQLFVCKPDLTIPPHTHPNVDSFEVHLDGGVDFFVDERRAIPRKVLDRRDGDCSAWYGWAVRVRPGVVHRAQVGPQGGSFLSIQHWPEGIPMSSVGHDWAGPTMGPKHSQEIQ